MCPGPGPKRVTIIQRDPPEFMQGTPFMSPYHLFVHNVSFREPLRLSDARCVTMPLCDTSFFASNSRIYGP